ncbi:MAG TPA: enoyl-CoA hydratase-related protein [Dehalococcoidia bacterium]|jgi:2-(1,2-epoxy-1,2-dihydrophenyl)acetyl-CoA isomerase
MTSTAPAYSDILYELHDDGVLVLTLNRPDRMNALGGALVTELMDAFQRARFDDEIRALVLTGAGRGFCAGADLSRGTPRSGDTARHARLDRMGRAGPFQLALRDLDKPTIGAINGVVAGAGIGIATALDIRIASSAARFSTVFIKRGLGPDFGSSYFIPRLVGSARAYELFFTGRFVMAEEALQIGLVNRVVEPEKLMDEALALAHELAAGPPQAMTFTRRALQRSLQNTLEQQLEFEWTNQIVALDSEDAREGVQAWLEKRPPRFLGR